MVNVSDGHCRKVLIADDDEFFRMALSKMLTEKLGFTDVVETASFDEALDQLLINDDFTLGLFDLGMPGIDSPAALRTVRESFSIEKVAVVSGSRRRTDIILALEAGAHGYIPKWLGATELWRALSQVVDGTVYVPANIAELSAGGPSISGDIASSRGENRLPPLTPRQLDVLKMLVDGKSNKEIARTLELGEGTVKVHLAALFRNLGVANRASAAVRGAEHFRRAGQI
jgi:DNA-binding NarL/FixJ family response regulator